MIRLSARTLLLECVCLLVGTAAGWSAGCGAGNSETRVGGDGGVTTSEAGNRLDGSTGTSNVPMCTECVTNADCLGGSCAQIQGDTFCVSRCEPAGEGLGACAAGTECSLETAANGDQLSACVPTTACPGGGPPTVVDGGGSSAQGDAGSSTCVPASSNCEGYAPPDSLSTCDSCSTSSSSCQPNGCYGGWYCDVATSSCHKPPTGCRTGGQTCADAGGTHAGSGSGSGSGGSTGGGPTLPATVTGSVTASGGSVSSLLFAIAGDTRPANVDDTAGYPTTIIETLFSDIAARSPQPSFVISTGDYQFATAPPPSGQTSTSAPQLALFMQARAKFPGTWFPAMGNHECNGYTVSNCGSGNADGLTLNYTNFLSVMLGPVSQSLPYYAIKVGATDGTWTSKLVFIAANAWDAAQSTWLDAALAESTTYTFVIRHEASEADTAPGVKPSDAILAKYPLTLEICGHTHDYSKSGNKIVLENGGAPLTGSGDYGYGVVAQRSDGNIVVDEIDYQTGAADSSFHFVVTPTGTVTQ